MKTRKQIMDAIEAHAINVFGGMEEYEVKREFTEIVDDYIEWLENEVGQKVGAKEKMVAWDAIEAAVNGYLKPLLLQKIKDDGFRKK